MAFSNHDIVSDSPTNNFATLNQLAPDNGNISFGNGNLSLYPTSSSNYGRNWWPSMLLPTKTNQAFYFEFTGGNGPTSNNTNMTIMLLPESEIGSPSALSNFSNVFYGENFYSTLDPSNVSGVLIDFVNSKVTIFSNNVEITAKSLNISIPNNVYNVALSFQTGTGGHVYYNLNFGQDPFFGGEKSPITTYPDSEGYGQFYYQPPTGALALCTANLSEMTPTVDDDFPQDYFKAVTYTGNGGTQSITGIGFQPDFVWVKKTTATSNHFLVDSVSGANKELNSNNTNAQSNNTGGIQSFNSSSFTVGADGGVNGSSETYVAWCFRAGGAPTTDNTATSGAMNANGSAATSSNSSVSINGVLQSNYTPAGSPDIYPTRMSINTDAGFSIVLVSGISYDLNLYTIPHGLTKTPEFSIVKNLDYTDRWYIRHQATDGLLALNETWSETQLPNYWSNKPFDENIITIQGNSFVGNSTQRLIWYHFYSVEGYSKFGSYTGNGSTDGPFFFTGFRPAWVLIKRVSATDNWSILDNQRPTYNPAKELLANLDLAEGSNGYVDLVSNGIKIRSGDNRWNGSGSTYIYMAFAEQPFNYANAR